MGVFIDITGRRYGRLTVLRFHERRNGKTFWHCECDCGTRNIIRGDTLGKNANSCGCYKSERFGNIMRTHGESHRTHTITYTSWQAMKVRCLTPKLRAYKYYGGRGIKVCDRWLNSYENFLADMGVRPGLEYSIHRIDNDGNYEPSNCAWVLDKMQMSITRKNTWIEYGGKRMILSDWARKFSTYPSYLCSMLKRRTFDEVYKHFEKRGLINGYDFDYSVQAASVHKAGA